MTGIIPKGTLCSINGDIIFTRLPSGHLGIYMTTDPEKNVGIVFAFDNDRWKEFLLEANKFLEQKGD